MPNFLNIYFDYKFIYFFYSLFSKKKKTKKDDCNVSINDNEKHENVNKLNSLSIQNLNLCFEQLWDYTCDLTHNRNVSYLCWNEQNHVR